MINLPKVIAHRGASGYAPENTFSAMSEAYRLGCQWVEFDVMLTKDEVAVIIHDYSLSRTTNGYGEVCKNRYHHIAKLDAGSWFSPEFSGEKVPHLAELLEYLRQHSFSINVEIKPAPGFAAMTAKRTWEILQKYWMDHNSLLISSAEMTSLTTIRDLDKKTKLGIIMHEWKNDWQQQLEEVSGSAIVVNHEILTKDRCQKIKDKGYWLLSYTVNNDQLATELFAWGVDTVFSDFPDKIIT